jgi:hypothetical protein
MSKRYARGPHRRRPTLRRDTVLAAAQSMVTPQRRRRALRADPRAQAAQRVPHHLRYQLLELVRTLRAQALMLLPRGCARAGDRLDVGVEIVEHVVRVRQRKREWSRIFAQHWIRKDQPLVLPVFAEESRPRFLLDELHREPVVGEIVTFPVRIFRIRGTGCRVVDGKSSRTETVPALDRRVVLDNRVPQMRADLGSSLLQRGSERAHLDLLHVMSEIDQVEVVQLVAVSSPLET